MAVLCPVSGSIVTGAVIAIFSPFPSALPDRLSPKINAAIRRKPRLPANYTLATLPRPRNPAVVLREVPARRYAVLRFSGLAGQEKVQQKINELMQWMRQRGLDAAGAPRLARYNPPWTLPFLRRNEVMIEIRPLN